MNSTRAANLLSIALEQWAAREHIPELDRDTVDQHLTECAEHPLENGVLPGSLLHEAAIIHPPFRSICAAARRRADRNHRRTGD